MKNILIVVSLFVLATVAFTFFKFQPDRKNFPVTTLPTPGQITVQGVLVCLPHKNTEGPQTLECAFGLKTDSGTYYALSDTDPSYKNISTTPMNTRVQVEGDFEPRSESNYQDIGIIKVKGITRLD